MKMARIIDDVVSDVIVPIDGFAIEECFHPDVLAQYVIAPDDAQPGWILTENGIVDPNAPEPEPEPEAEAEVAVEEAPAEEAPVEEAPAEEAPAEEAPAA